MLSYVYNNFWEPKRNEKIHYSLFSQFKKQLKNYVIL